MSPLSIKHILPFIILVCVLIGLVMTFDRFTFSPLDSNESFSFPTYAVRGQDGELTLIDQSQRRVLGLHSDGTLAFQLHGGKRESDSFFYTQEVAVGSDGKLFLINQVLDNQGFFLVREEIQQYSPKGKFVKTLHKVDIDKKPHRMVQRTWSLSLKISGQELSWFELSPEGILPYVCSLDEEKAIPVSRAVFSVPDAHLAVVDVDWFDQDHIVYSLKSGQIVRQGKDPETSAVLYDADSSTRPRTNNVPPIPWGIEVDNGTIYFADLTNRELCRIESDGHITTVCSNFKSDIYRLSAAGGVLTTCCGNEVISIDEQTGAIIAETDHARLTLTQRYFKTVFWFFAVLALICLAWCIRIVYRDVFRRRPPRGLMQAIGVLLIIVVTLAASLPLILNRMIDRQQSLLIDRINQMVHTIPMMLDAEKIESIKTASDYGGEDYRQLRRRLYEIFNENRDPWNTGWYFVLYRVYDDRIFGLMYRNELIGPFHPFTWGEEVDKDYIRTMSEGTVRTAIQDDNMGRWIYGIAPIRNEKGEIVAVFETGTDLYAMTLENRKLLSDVLLDMTTVLVIIVLCMFEFLFFLNLRSSQAKQIEQHHDTSNLSSTFLTRPCAFLFFTAISLPVAFLPLVMKSLYHPVSGFSEEMILAAPISVQMLCFGLGTLLAGWAITTFGIFRILQFAFLFAGLGLFFGVIVQDMFFFLTVTAFLGFGTGMAFICIRSVLLQEPNQELRDLGYSYFYAGMTAGVNVGLVFGAGLADHTGFHAVFAVALALLALAWLFSIFYIPSLNAPRQNPEVKLVGEIGLLRFIRSPLVLVFLLFHVIPVYAIAAYIYYFFPIFAESEGVSTGNIGRFLILNGLMIIYIGPVLGPFLLRKFSGQTAFMLGQLTWVIGTAVVFACFPTVAGAVVALILFGIAEGVVAAGDMSYYLQLDAVKRFGEERAIAVFELVGKLGETIGPIVFALALGLGLSNGMILLGGGCGLTLLLLILINRACETKEHHLS